MDHTSQFYAKPSQMSGYPIYQKRQFTQRGGKLSAFQKFLIGAGSIMALPVVLPFAVGAATVAATRNKGPLISPIVGRRTIQAIGDFAKQKGPLAKGVNIGLKVKNTRKLQKKH